MKNVIILNGAPGIGKDTIAEIISRKWQYKNLSFKQPMFAIARAVLGSADFARFTARYHDRKHKEVKCDFLGDRSPREFILAKISSSRPWAKASSESCFAIQR